MLCARVRFVPEPFFTTIKALLYSALGYRAQRAAHKGASFFLPAGRIWGCGFVFQVWRLILRADTHFFGQHLSIDAIFKQSLFSRGHAAASLKWAD